MKIRHIILTILASVWFSGFATDLSNEMQNFLNGCVAMRQAVENNDFTRLTDAKLHLSKVKTREYVQGVDFFLTDNSNTESLGLPQLLFTPEYASTLSREKKIVLRDISDVHLMRGIEGLNIWHASIMPGKEVALKGCGINYCELMLFALKDSGLKLRVYSLNNEEQPVEEVADGAWVSTWTMPKMGDFQFVITNEGDKPQTFVIALN